MSDNFESSLINLGELSKPATVLVERISDAVGGIFKPYQIVRVAKAEAQADRVRAEGQIEISDLQRRAFHRFLEEEAKKQKNIEDITQKALPLLNEDSKPNELENDWIANFFDRCRLISDEDMQVLWSKILAGEANAPGAYSKRTVNLLSNLDQYDATLFTQLCRFGLDIQGLTPLVYDESATIYRKHGIELGTIRHLEAIGLLSYELNGFRGTDLRKTYSFFESTRVSYFNRLITLVPDAEEPSDFPIGKVMLTKAGEQLAGICEVEEIEGFLDYLNVAWGLRGYSMESDGD